MVRCSTMQYNAVQCSTMTHKVGSIQGSIRGVKSSHVDTSRLRYRFTMLLAGRIYLPLQGRRTRVPVGRDALPRSPAAACTRLQLAGRCAWRCVAAREGTREGKGVHKRCHAASPARASSRVMPCLPPPPLGAPTTSLPLPAPPPPGAQYLLQLVGSHVVDSLYGRACGAAVGGWQLAQLACSADHPRDG